MHRTTALLREDGTGARLLSRVTQRSWNELDLKPGRGVYAQIKGAALYDARVLRTDITSAYGASYIHDNTASVAISQTI
jgi:hypothetical protein